MILVDLQGVSVRRPTGEPLLDDVALTLESGDRLGVVGLNGSGKSTLLRILAGVSEPDLGEVRAGRDARVVMLDQAGRLPDGTVRQAVGDGWEAAAVLDRLGLSELADRDVASLSGGQAKRIALARALVHEADLLVLDEPTNHLDIEGITWLEDRLAGFTGGLVLVTHDRHLLDRLTTEVLEIDRGRTYLHVPSGPQAGSGYAAYLTARAEREERAAQAESVRRNLARTELAWLRRGAPARTSKPKHRIEQAERLLASGPQAAVRPGELDLSAFGATRLGSKVLELHDVGHRFGPDQPWLFRHLDLPIEPGDRLGVVGPNGAGKSTLLDVIAGRRAPLEGSVDRGTTVRLGLYDQLGRDLPLDQRVRDVVAGPSRPADYRDDALLDRFWFDADARWAPIRLLSGGERRRLQLVLVLAEQPNVLVLDEPTNDLDLDTLRALEGFLDDWPGALVVVSHDRAFLERTVDEVLALDGHGGAAMVPGGATAWVAALRGGGRARAERTTRPGATTGSAATPPAAAGRTEDGPKRRTPSTLGRLLREAERDLERATRRRDDLAAELHVDGRRPRGAGPAGHRGGRGRSRRRRGRGALAGPGRRARSRPLIVPPLRSAGE